VRRSQAVGRRMNRSPDENRTVDEIITSVAPEAMEQTVLPYVERMAAWGDPIRTALERRTETSAHQWV
jgi:hypothetical protein